MNEPALASLTHYFLVFCRIGTCLAFVPVFSSLRLPMRARLFLALGISTSITPLIPTGAAVGGPHLGAHMLIGITAECFIGAALGLTARIIFSAAQMAGALLALSAGFSSPPAVDDGNGELQPEAGALVSLAVLVVMITLDFIGEFMLAIIESFDAIPLGLPAEPGRALDVLTGAAGQSIALAVRISAPFIFSGILINFAFGMVNKLVAQLPVIFISVPFLLAAAVWLLQHSGAELVGNAARRLIAMLGGL